MQVAAIGDSDDGGGGETRVAVRRQWVGIMKDGGGGEEENNCLLMPKLSIGISKSRCSIWASCGSEGKWGRYIALISICNEGQHGAGGSCEFLVM